ncbi:MAG: hypothetical protein Q7U98_06390 [Methylicorpusculum sp.]|uniref:hypothetical protein n=1 Tax=Methylicorpusculum sp. TaxID=2713644 RepID=UPI0027197934|nr:hypothetical protein [Methylicorpusculum sp.]MDO8938768.1 hypothetical protein [Methylicorpusculum sp.]MDP2201240.1 hypothetical protein [Methylicorpusculum sp.]
MTVQPKVVLRLHFLVQVVRKECKHLKTTDERLFNGNFGLEQILRLEETALGEKTAFAIDNLDLAE